MLLLISIEVRNLTWSCISDFSGDIIKAQLERTGFRSSSMMSGRLKNQGFPWACRAGCDWSKNTISRPVIQPWCGARNSGSQNGWKSSLYKRWHLKRQIPTPLPRQSNLKDYCLPDRCHVVFRSSLLIKVNAGTKQRRNYIRRLKWTDV